jgi:hypothetical protein
VHGLENLLQIERCFCQNWNLGLSTLSRAADEYLLREHRLHAFAADAGAGGDRFFLSVAAALETLRAEQQHLPLSCPLLLEQLFSEDASRAANSQTFAQHCWPRCFELESQAVY